MFDHWGTIRAGSHKPSWFVTINSSSAELDLVGFWKPSNEAASEEVENACENQCHTYTAWACGPTCLHRITADIVIELRFCQNTRENFCWYAAEFSTRLHATFARPLWFLLLYHVYIGPKGTCFCTGKMKIFSYA